MGCRGLAFFQSVRKILASGEWPGRGGFGVRALRVLAPNFRTDKTAQSAVFPSTERLLLEGADRPPSVPASRPVRRMVVQSNP